MNTPWEIIAELESDNSRLFKESVVAREALAKNTEFFAGVSLALDSMVSFGVKQVPEKTEEDGEGLSWDSFVHVAQRLRNRELTGNVARSAVDAMMNTATKSQWNGWYRRILIKDLRCGVSEKTVNNVVKKKHAQYSVPVFSCQLAHDSTNHESKVAGEKLIEVKLDGVRVITIVYPDGRCDQFSRNGKELVNFPHIVEQLKFVASIGGITEPVVLDGEIMSGSFQDLMKQVHRKSNVQSTDAVLHLFDMLPLDEFEAGLGTSTQMQRSDNLESWYAVYENAMPNVSIVGTELVDLDTAAGQQTYSDINRRAIAGGYEGIMIKDPAGVYQCKRSTAWLKLKPFIEVTLGVTDVEEGTGKNLGRLGALVCTGIDDGKEITVNVGSGFSDELRDSIWASRNSVVGQLVEVRADAVTQNQDGSYSLRFPRFKTFRGFEPGEKL